ncbi:MAG: hypothetical protein A2015_00570 [Spirochaetes bacterium GWF1_31_7]|nr:MAG: hypothetical protein A2Y30_03940 [Spirochaetes bacterium GWE1_32_154]OHD45166.1 MAG: hypothetical protein A2Y29_15955 [Spirochaetes bacterium GWE2_31_10]OHD51076.1 MAG: hypothetical protein A2015_00570 [Spirochaetes bacterium GWF1_31_7]OHD80599.1 MAG: hypothetical protein A2355_07700 [Spirochaetes bacterium RIFOXYB1_FULL_32_8]HBD94801.1 hypothetical protein [Spirochaetia bacterium]
MTNDQIEKYKEILLIEKKEIVNELLESDATARDLLENEMHAIGDSADEASVNITQNLLNVTSAKNRQTLMGIEAALRRIEEKSFGSCVSCGCEINTERLDALPWASMCIKCKTQNEKAHK